MAKPPAALNWANNVNKKSTVFNGLMKHLPLFFNLDGKRCLLIGGGRIGNRRAESMMNAGAAIEGINDCRDGAPDLGAFEQGNCDWRAGSSLTMTDVR